MGGGHLAGRSGSMVCVVWPLAAASLPTCFAVLRVVPAVSGMAAGSCSSSRWWWLTRKCQRSTAKEGLAPHAAGLRPLAVYGCIWLAVRPRAACIQRVQPTPLTSFALTIGCWLLAFGLHLRALQSWPSGLFSMPALVDAVAARMKRQGGDNPHLWRLLAWLYQQQVRCRPGLARAWPPKHSLLIVVKCLVYKNEKVLRCIYI